MKAKKYLNKNHIKEETNIFKYILNLRDVTKCTLMLFDVVLNT